MLVVTGGLGVGIFEFFLDISPDFAVFEIWIELNDFNHLFFRWAELVEVKAASVESAENDSSDVKTLGKVLHYACQFGFRILRLFVTCLKSLKK